MAAAVISGISLVFFYYLTSAKVAEWIVRRTASFNKCLFFILLDFYLRLTFVSISLIVIFYTIGDNVKYTAVIFVFGISIGLYRRLKQELYRRRG